MENRNQLLEQTPISKLIWKMTIPSVIGVMAYNLYNIFDTLFISQGVGTDAVGGVAISFPLFGFLSAVSSTLGTGAASVISRALGEKDKERATKTAANTFMVFYAVAILVTVFGLVYLDPLLHAMGVTETLLPYARSYTRIILLGAVTSTGFSNLIRAEGDSKYAMLIWVIPMASNTILDLFFIFGLKMGVVGAALGTVAGQAISMLMSINFFFLSGRSTLKFRLWHFRPDKKIIGEIITIGIPSFLQLSGYSISIMIVNQFLRGYGGDLPISTYGIVSKINTFILFPVMGLIQGIQPIIGYNNGGKKYERVKETLFRGAGISVIYGIVAYLVIWNFPNYILSFFTNDTPVVQLGVSVLRITNAGIMFTALQNVLSTYFQSIGKKMIALFLVLCNQVICFIPAMIVLSKLWGLQGIWWGFPISGMIALIISMLITFKYLISESK